PCTDQQVLDRVDSEAGKKLEEIETQERQKNDHELVLHRTFRHPVGIDRGQEVDAESTFEDRPVGDLVVLETLGEVPSQMGHLPGCFESFTAHLAVPWQICSLKLGIGPGRDEVHGGPGSDRNEGEVLTAVQGEVERKG